MVIKGSSTPTRISTSSPKPMDRVTNIHHSLCRCLFHVAAEERFLAMWLIAPEILRVPYGPNANNWSAGVIVYVLLRSSISGEDEHDIFEEVLHGDLDFSSDPWPSV